MSARHPSTTQLMQWFDASHLPKGPIRETSQWVQQLAHNMVEDLKDGPELSAGLRKLLEAKDCFVRQAIADQR